jgi:hypothetical protein
MISPDLLNMSGKRLGAIYSRIDLSGFAYYVRKKLGPIYIHSKIRYLCSRRFRTSRSTLSNCWH